jgi:cyclopropane-fatty-acyl-phospholipid synthase
MLKSMLRRLIQTGRLVVIWPDGTSSQFGEASKSDDVLDIIVRLKGALTPLKLAINPEFYLGEAYVDGALLMERGTLWDLLELCATNLFHQNSSTTRSRFVHMMKALIRWPCQHNTILAARRNAAHHYNLSYLLYRQFLDRDLQYSCAYFRDPHAPLDEAQRAKRHHIAAKLILEGRHRVLDIGCGWGGLALELARNEHVEVLGVTLSREQLSIAQGRARNAGLADRVKFELRDYREVEGQFDRIVSVGMFEHVGSRQYQTFFKTISRLLTNEGVALVHSIGRMRGPDVTSAWIRKYIFPGGHIPALSEVMPAIEGAGLWITDLEVLRLHYAKTLRFWRERFMANVNEVRAIYDDRFCRMWEFYLAASEMSFRYRDLMVFQVQLARRIDIVPLTRDYIFDHELGSPHAVATE